ncbi:MAG: tRNA adenosine(34) deaminase TadA [Lachnospiraceae bacterium]|nr:tRNA adenosine(34) deaminase TadA [Lachnospiraceae bacterium]
MNIVTEKTLRKRENRLQAKEEKRLRLEEEARRAAEQQRKEDEKYMRQALKLARKAAELDEVPIGCVIVHEGKVIARGYNRRNTDKSTLAHAEISAIRKASKKMSDWRLEECTLYVTLEPCQMCAGAIVQARVSRVVIGAMNPKAGCAGSVLNLLEMKEFNHRADVTRGILEEECAQILKEFFSSLRKRVKV